MSRQLLLASSSRCHPHEYLDHCETEIRELFAGVSEIIFVPYARPAGSTPDEYTNLARARFEKMEIRIRGLHEFADQAAAIRMAAGVFVGGGNTFVLLRELYRLELLDVLRACIQGGLPYFGTSAGSNLAGVSIGTSNDMPIVHPPSLEALSVVPFNLNPHLPRAQPDPTHKGETRLDRIREFHVFNSQPVIGLYEDGMLRVSTDRLELIGSSPAVIFKRGQEPLEVPPGQIAAEC